MNYYFQKYSLKWKMLIKLYSSLYLKAEIDPNNNLWLFMIKRTSLILPNYLWLQKIFLKSGFSTSSIYKYIYQHIYICIHTHTHTHTHTHIYKVQMNKEALKKSWSNLENRIVVDWIHVYTSVSYGEIYSSCDNISKWEMIQSRRLSSHKWDWCPSKEIPASSLASSAMLRL